MFNVREEPTVSAAGSVALGNKSSLFGFACTRHGIGDTYVAFSQHSSVFLKWLFSSSDKPLSSITVNKTIRLVFCKELLLVARWYEGTQAHAIESLRASGGALVKDGVLLAAKAKRRRGHLSSLWRPTRTLGFKFGKSARLHFRMSNHKWNLTRESSAI